MTEYKDDLERTPGRYMQTVETEQCKQCGKVVDPDDGDVFQHIREEHPGQIQEMYDGPQFEVVNPSDYAIMEAPFKPAVIATFLFGGPAYGLKEKGGDDEWPVTMRTGTWMEYFQDRFDQTVAEAWNEVGTDTIVQALRSVELMGQRTSLNDFTQRADDVADLIESAEPERLMEIVEAGDFKQLGEQDE